MFMQRLSGQDAAFLYMETPSSHMHVGSIGVFDPSTSPVPYSWDRVVQAVRERIHLVPLFRKRIVNVPFELHHPIWVDDPDFDLEYHLRRAALPSPGGTRELADFTADVMSRPLDRNRPLWEMYLVEGLEGGHIGVVSKTHHAAIDGVSGVDLSLVLLDLTPEPAAVEAPAEPWRPEAQPSDFEMVSYAAGSLARQPVRLARTAFRTGRNLLGARQSGSGGRPSMAMPFSAPRTSLNVSVSPHRSLALASVSLERVKAVKSAFGATVNDVVLSMCGGALRRYFESRNEAVDQDLIAMVPVSVRGADQQGALGNQISSMLISLATTVEDPVERLRRISEITREAKDAHNAIGADTLQQFSEFAFPALATRAARLYSRTQLANRHRPFFNLTISNVPGPPFPLYSIGSQLVATYPVGPINEGAALNITAASYMGEMYFGLHACREVVTNPWSIADYLTDSLTELEKAAGQS